MNMLEKVCRVCGNDVSNAKRVKDPQGNYYCQACYEARSPTQSSPPAPPPPPSPVRVKVAAAAPLASAPAQDEYDLADENRDCPECGERIKAKARKCRFCGATFDAARDTAVASTFAPSLIRCPKCGGHQDRNTMVRRGNSLVCSDCATAGQHSTSKVVVLLAVACLALIVLGVGGFFLWQQYGKEASASRPTLATPATASSTAQTIAPKTGNSKATTNVANRPAEPTAPQTASFSGEVWITLGDGSTLSLADADVLLLPQRIKPDEDFTTAIERAVLYGGETESEKRGARTVSGSEAKQFIRVITFRTIVRDPAQKALETGSASSADVVNWAYQMIDQDPYLIQNALVGQRAHDPTKVIRDEYFWKSLRKQAVMSVSTGRDGKFTMNAVAPGKYVVACRYYRSGVNELLFWGEAVELQPGTAAAISLSGKSSKVLEIKP